LRTRVSGSDLDAPEPNVTARPARDVEPPPAEPVERLPEAAPAVALEFNGTSRPDAVVPAADLGTAKKRQPRPGTGLPPAASLRAVNASYDEAFQQ
jgi:hypothetical protein